MLELNSRVGGLLESSRARGVMVGMVDDLNARFETLLVDVALLK